MLHTYIASPLRAVPLGIDVLRSQRSPPAVAPIHALLLITWLSRRSSILGMPILRISPKSIPSHRRRIGILMMRTSRFIIRPLRSSISMALPSAPRHLTRLLYLSSKGTRTSDGSISEWVLSHTSLAVGRSILSSRANGSYR